jgi:hypothetical protein
VSVALNAMELKKSAGLTKVFLLLGRFEATRWGGVQQVHSCKGGAEIKSKEQILVP